MEFRRSDLDLLRNAVKVVTGVFETDEQLEKRFELLPTEIKAIGERWGVTDKLFFDEFKSYLGKIEKEKQVSLLEVIKRTLVTGVYYFIPQNDKTAEYEFLINSDLENWLLLGLINKVQVADIKKERDFAISRLNMNIDTYHVWRMNRFVSRYSKLLNRDVPLDKTHKTN